MAGTPRPRLLSNRSCESRLITDTRRVDCLNMVKTPGATIARTVFHAKGWALEKWVGTNDTGATDSNPAGSGSPNNMVKVEAYDYDNNTAGGDGNRTKLTRYQDAATTRVTAYGYDFR